jgi:hypothetical protein
MSVTVGSSLRAIAIPRSRKPAKYSEDEAARRRARLA